MKQIGYFKALGDPTRFEIVQLIGSDELCACDLLSHFSFTQPTLSYHMKYLTECGLVNARKDGAWMRYSLNKDAFHEIQDMIEKILTDTSNRQSKRNVCGSTDGRDCI